MGRIRKAGKSIVAVVLTSIVILLTPWSPDLAELALFIGELGGVAPIPPAEIIPDIGDLAMQPGIVGTLGTGLLVVASVTAVFSIADRISDYWT